MSGIDNPRQFAGVLEGFSSCQVLVVGDLMLDEYLWGHIERISPEAPVPVFNLIRRESTLGGAGNVASNLSNLGARVILAGVVGQDGAGRQILEHLRARGVNAGAVVQDPHRQSTRKSRLMSLEHGQQVFRLDEESQQEVRGEVEERLIDRIRMQAQGARAVICSDYQKGLLTPRVLEAAFEAARRQRAPAIVGPKGSNAARYRGAAILMPNVRELAQLAGILGDEDDGLSDAARRLIQTLELEALIVTRGRDGMSLFEPHRTGLRRVDVPAAARSVFDVTGAGDTAIATFCLALAVGSSRELAVQMANHAAGVVVGKRGTAAITLDEIQAAFLEKAPGSAAPKTRPPRTKARQTC